jgi:hypothetical protein
MNAQQRLVPTALFELLTHCIDYAGVFPPARLSLTEAWEKYTRYLEAGESWILGSLVLPVDLLLSTERIPEKASFSLTVIPRRGETEEVWQSGLAEDLGRVRLFLETHPAVTLSGLEVALPPANDPSSLLEEVLPLVEGYRTFFELPAGEHLVERVRLTVMALYQHHNSKCGLKLRTGGADPNAFPTTHVVAEVLAGVRDRQIPLKFTAGLHHPILHWDDNLKVARHGFINLMMAGLLGHAYHLPRENIEAIVRDEKSSNFTFNDGVARWLDLPLRAEVIRELRSRVCGFGSCSIQEPLDDLRRIGWIS